MFAFSGWDSMSTALLDCGIFCDPILTVVWLLKVSLSRSINAGIDSGITFLSCLSVMLLFVIYFFIIHVLR